MCNIRSTKVEGVGYRSIRAVPFFESDSTENGMARKEVKVPKVIPESDNAAARRVHLRRVAGHRDPPGPPVVAPGESPPAMRESSLLPTYWSEST